MNKIILVGLLLLLSIGSTLAVSCVDFNLSNTYGVLVSDGVTYHDVNGIVYGESTILSNNYYVGYNYYIQGISNSYN